jgi:L-2-hydroxyglutarate oxidase LhgO
MDYDAIVIGAGVVGLAVAMKISEQMNVLVLERHSSFGRETSSRNSEVIHAGIYYPQDSLKAKLCVKGNDLLYQWCEKHDIPHKRIGKYIVAVTEEEATKLTNILKRARNNGVKEIDFADMTKFRNDEPYVKAIASLWSPNTGIVDSHQLMASFEKCCIDNNVDFAYNHEVFRIEKLENGFKIYVKGPEKEEYAVSSTKIINSAGLDSDTIASLAGIDIDKENYRLHYSKGHYFRIIPNKYHLVSHLIYPVPPKGLTNLGIHITVELDGSIKLGPDIEWLKYRRQDYNVSNILHNKFYESVSWYLNGIEHDDIFPDYSGIRPKLQRNGGEWRDFIIKEETEKGLNGFINLIGMESPGLTCCLSIAEYVNNIMTFDQNRTK